MLFALPLAAMAACLSSIRTDDLAAIPLKALMERNAAVEWLEVDDVIYGCANQSGEDNRNVARMALLLAGLPQVVPGVTVNRLCGSSMEAVAQAARAIKSGEAELVIAGGVESMSRAPYVMGKADAAFSRAAKLEDTTLGWRFVNPVMKERYGVDSMAETAENLAEEFHISRADQDAFAYRSQQRAAAAIRSGAMAEEICPVTIPQRKGAAVVVDKDEHPRPDTTLEALAALKPIVKPTGTVTAGNASGINDGACALLLASETAVKKYRTDAEGAHCCSGVGRRCATGNGNRADSGVAQSAGDGRIVDWRPGRDRTQRGVRGTSVGGAARVGRAG